MIEAQIRCVCSQIALPDLSMGLVKGQVEYLDASVARASRDLKRAWKAKAVAVRYVERFKQRRVAAHPTSPLPPAPMSMVAAPPEPEEDQDFLLVDPDAIAARVVAELSRSPLIQVEVSRQLGVLEDRLVTRVTAAVVAAFQGGRIPKAPDSTSRATPFSTLGRVDDTVPVFIPSRVGDDRLKADFGIEATQTDQEGVVSGAAAALRAARNVNNPDVGLKTR